MRSTMLDMDSRLRVASAVEKNETIASQSVFETLQHRGHPDAPPPTISDGWGGIDEAMIAVYGLVPEYSGYGRPPTNKIPGKNWLYLQMVKQHDERGHFTENSRRSLATNKNCSNCSAGVPLTSNVATSPAGCLMDAKQEKHSLFPKNLATTALPLFGRMPTITWSSLTRVCACLWMMFQNVSGNSVHL